MIFCGPADVDETWATVARATANNELGIAAKVRPGLPNQEPRPDLLSGGGDLSSGGADQHQHDPQQQQQQQRLICVYTADFGDVTDVRRVAARLRKLGLVAPRGRPLFYKPGSCLLLLPPPPPPPIPPLIHFLLSSRHAHLSFYLPLLSLASLLTHPVHPTPLVSPSHSPRNFTWTNVMECFRSRLTEPECSLADAYTYLGIARGNKWGIKPSIYDSRTLLTRK